MKACIVIHSQTGHTVSFARAIAESLLKHGCETDIELLRTTSFARPASSRIELRRVPDPSEYDILLTGAPVWAFKASPVIMTYLNELKTLKGKRAAPFVTHALPFKLFGYGRALARMSNALSLLGAQVVEGEEVAWLVKPARKIIYEASDRLAARIVSA